LKFNAKTGEAVPQTSVAGAFFTGKKLKFTGIEELSAYDWFIPPDDDERAERKMYEQCFYSDSFGYVISLMWFD